MRNIYLASGSRARRDMLKTLGLKFKVIKTNVRELRIAKGISYGRMAELNALKKAEAAAKEVKEGVIIAADTITVLKGKVFGKPRDMRDAARMLRSLSRYPQWVYSAVALIDKDRGVRKTGYEKTKVFMDKLSDKEIADYFRKVSPLDKAGSFDIQGKGAFFIRRIEGCYYTVVGLPLRKLYRMLKEININLMMALLTTSFCLLTAVFSSGCSTEYNIATGEQEYFYYDTDKEVQVGRSSAKAVEEEYNLTQDPLMQRRVEDIGSKIADVCDRRDIEYSFKVLDDDEVNAFALPGGFIYVNKGLVEKVSGDDELAAVLAHEVAHVVARHSIKKLQAVMGYSLLRLTAIAMPSPGETAAAADAVFTEVLLGYSREDELLADQLGARYVKAAGYEPAAMISFLEKLQELNRRKPLRPKSYFKTHPYVPDRIRVVKQELGEKLGFTDYINIEQREH